MILLLEASPRVQILAFPEDATHRLIRWLSFALALQMQEIDHRAIKLSEQDIATLAEGRHFVVWQGLAGGVQCAFERLRSCLEIMVETFVGANSFALGPAVGRMSSPLQLFPDSF
ncbi:hypothetical protein [Thiorhodococcus minor]|uniref:Uncharacterized protein n=1 Tax=Thiorhodococcus minor TaxID=57489 RepID=A0A6M0JZ06_9GAMM|nr:hypothetical protein [Thiorhodococcus minor]NEV61597.1 hypothetical protein [Thiorhodococcus minor]